jgi:hypothetical protein
MKRLHLDTRTWFPLLVSLTESMRLRPLTRWLCRTIVPPLGIG